MLAMIPWIRLTRWDYMSPTPTDGPRLTQKTFRDSLRKSGLIPKAMQIGKQLTEVRLNGASVLIDHRATLRRALNDLYLRITTARGRSSRIEIRDPWDRD